ncbi:hypothetical protein EVAR_3103_1 [Eumeta japonica]|uniref:Uncharacterized protein n=1 Tax=Eumeta variegata TaxID=151549 RepID=A0A4C1XEQ0_EUMVA|nr:hypothetical protein EVAR_3103_1 [Eumeta japonica]
MLAQLRALTIRASHLQESAEQRLPGQLVSIYRQLESIGFGARRAVASVAGRALVHSPHEHRENYRTIRSDAIVELSMYYFQAIQPIAQCARAPVYGCNTPTPSAIAGAYRNIDNNLKNVMDQCHIYVSATATRASGSPSQILHCILSLLAPTFTSTNHA